MRLSITSTVHKTVRARIEMEWRDPDVLFNWQEDEELMRALRTRARIIAPIMQREFFEYPHPPFITNLTVEVRQIIRKMHRQHAGLDTKLGRLIHDA